MLILSMLTALAGTDSERPRPAPGARAVQVTGVALTTNGAPSTVTTQRAHLRGGSTVERSHDDRAVQGLPPEPTTEDTR